jgi:hypothetical protein
VAHSCEHKNKPLGSIIKGGTFFIKQLNIDSVPWTTNQGLMLPLQTHTDLQTELSNVPSPLLNDCCRKFPTEYLV